MSEGCSDNGTSTEEDEVDNSSKGGSQVDGATASKKVELTEDMCNGDLAQDMKVRWTVVECTSSFQCYISLCCKLHCISLLQTFIPRYVLTDSHEHYYGPHACLG